jgi:hypothetical protein
LTCTPYRAHSIASTFVRCRIAALDAQYALKPETGMRPKWLATLMTFPDPCWVR